MFQPSIFPKHPVTFIVRAMADRLPRGSTEIFFRHRFAPWWVYLGSQELRHPFVRVGTSQPHEKNLVVPSTSLVFSTGHSKVWRYDLGPSDRYRCLEGLVLHPSLGFVDRRKHGVWAKFIELIGPALQPKVPGFRSFFEADKKRRTTPQTQRLTDNRYENPPFGDSFLGRRHGYFAILSTTPG